MYFSCIFLSFLFHFSSQVMWRRALCARGFLCKLSDLGDCVFLSDRQYVKGIQRSAIQRRLTKQKWPTKYFLPLRKSTPKYHFVGVKDTFWKQKRIVLIKLLYKKSNTQMICVKLASWKWTERNKTKCLFK